MDKNATALMGNNEAVEFLQAKAASETNLGEKELKVTPDLRGCPPVSSGKKIRMRAILKEGMANYISLESLINVDFGKKYELPVFLIPQKNLRK